MRAELKEELQRAGLLTYRPVATYLKAGVLLALAAGAQAGFVLVPHLWARGLLFVAAVVLTIALVMVGHESGHRSVSRRPRVNDFLGYLTFPLIAGVSFDFWRHKHNQHHAYVNMDGRDPDVPIFPLAMTPAERVNRSGLARLLQRLQPFALWPLTLLTGFAFRVDGVRFILGAGRRLGSASERWLDRLCLAGHVALWFAFPVALGFPLLSVALFYVAWTVGAGLLLAVIFLPAHTPFPLFSDADNNLQLQLETSQNLLTNRLFSWLLIGLDHQVEHHLFPRMSHLNVHRAAPIVRAFCARHARPIRSRAGERRCGRARWRWARGGSGSRSRRRRASALQRRPYESFPQRAVRRDLAGVRGGSDCPAHVGRRLAFRNRRSTLGCRRWSVPHEPVPVPALRHGTGRRGGA